MKNDCLETAARPGVSGSRHWGVEVGVGVVLETRKGFQTGAGGLAGLALSPPSAVL